MLPSSLFRLARFPLSVLAAALLLGNCTKGKDDSTGPVGGDDTGTVVSSLFGQVLDDTGGALAGVTVTADSYVDTTDANGLFTIKDAKVPKGRAVIIAKKAGYYNGSRAEEPGSNGQTRLRLRMMKKTFSQSVSASSGGTVDVTGGAKVDFEGGSFVTASGTAYTGTVQIAAKYLNPDSGTFSDFFSGDNQGRETGGGRASLISLGVLRVELQGTGGQAIKLAAGKPATLTYPKPSGDAPSTMPLWYFDEEAGMWKEEGSATLKDGAYVGTVTHFSDWNLDYKGPTWDFYLRILCDSIPMEGVVVRTHQRIGISDPKGVIHFINAPKDLGANKLEILADDNHGIFFKDNAAYINFAEGNQDTFDLKLDSPCPAAVIGDLVDCEDKPVGGWATATMGKAQVYAYTLDGRFLLRVPDGVPVTFNASDIANNKLAAPMVLASLGPNEHRNLGKVKICGTQVAGDWIDIKPDSLDFIQGWAISPDATVLATAAKNPEKMLIYDTKTGSLIQEFGIGYAIWGGHMQISADNKRLLIATAGRTNADVYDISVKPAKLLTTITPLSHAELSDDGKTVFGSSGNGTAPIKVAIYSADDGKEIKVLHPPFYKGEEGFGGVHQIKLMPGQNAFFYRRRDSTDIFRVWSIENDTIIRDINTKIGVGTFLYLLEYSRDGSRFWVSEDYLNAHVFNSLTGDKIGVFTPFQPSTQSKTIQASLSANFIFSVNTITGIQVIQQFKLDDMSLVNTYPVPETPDFNRRVYKPTASDDEKTMIAEVRYPTPYPTVRSGYRVYKVK